MEQIRWAFAAAVLAAGIATAHATTDVEFICPGGLRVYWNETGNIWLAKPPGTSLTRRYFYRAYVDDKGRPTDGANGGHWTSFYHRGRRCVGPLPIDD
jgi:hypothetical protein